jgi:hypothetical protein
MRMARNVAGVGVLGSLSLLAACGDPVPPAAQAGISIHLENYDDTHPVYGKSDCPPYRHWVNVPFDSEHAAGTAQRQLTDAMASVRAVNNQEGNSVSCSVKASGSGFSVKGDATAYAEYNGMKFRPSIVHLRIPSIASGDNNAKGTLSLQDDSSINLYSSDQCTFTVQGGNYGVDAGRIWGALRCDGLIDPSTPDAACLVDNGFFVLENCAQ